MNPTFLISAMGKVVGQTGLFNKGKKKLWIQTC